MPSLPPVFAGTPTLLYPAAYPMHPGWVNDFRSLPRPIGSLALCTRGEGSYESEDCHFSVSPGELLFIPPGGRYFCRWGDRDSELRAIHFELPPSRIRYYVQKLTDPAILALAAPAIGEIEAGFSHRTLRPDADRCRILAQFYGLFAAVLPSLAGEEQGMTDSRIREAAAKIEADPAAAPSVSELAADAHMSLPHFHACFKRDIGTSPIAYRQQQRIRMAQRLLLAQPDRPIGEIALSLGFSSETYFRRTFLSLTGIPPREFRRRGFGI